MQTAGKLLMIAAPSGAGKSSLTNAFLAKHADWSLSISTTTRAPRPGELHGREYFFTDRQSFIAQRDSGAFLEWAEVHGNFYGTSKQWVLDQLAKHQNILLEIDWQGAQQIRQIFGQGPSRKAFSSCRLALKSLSAGSEPEAKTARRSSKPGLRRPKQKFHTHKNLIMLL